MQSTTNNQYSIVILLDNTLKSNEFVGDQTILNFQLSVINQILIQLLSKDALFYFSIITYGAEYGFRISNCNEFHAIQNVMKNINGGGISHLVKSFKDAKTGLMHLKSNKKK